MAQTGSRAGTCHAPRIRRASVFSHKVDVQLMIMRLWQRRPQQTHREGRIGRAGVATLPQRAF